MSTLVASALGERAHRWSNAGIAVGGALAVTALSVVIAVVQSVWGPLLDGFALEGWRIGVVAMLLGVADAMVLLGVVLLVFWGVGRLTRAPKDAGASTLVVVVAALLASAICELAACLAELSASGSISDRLVSDPSHWLDPAWLGVLSLSNITLYAVAVTGAVRDLGWTVPRVIVLVPVLAGLATASSVVA